MQDTNDSASEERERRYGEYSRGYTEQPKGPDSIPNDWPFPPCFVNSDSPRAPEVQSLSPELHESLLAQESVHAARRSYRSLLWWTPEVLSLTLGVGSMIGRQLYPVRRYVEAISY